jgi:hypothetical protein
VRILVTVAALLLFASGTSQAMKISDYLAKKEVPKQRDLINLYLNGYIIGLLQSNDTLEARGQQKLFCMPDEEAFRQDVNHRLDFLDNILSKTATYVKDDTTIEIALLSTLVNTYPCKTGAPGKKKK